MVLRERTLHVHVELHEEVEEGEVREEHVHDRVLPEGDFIVLPRVFLRSVEVLALEANAVQEPARVGLAEHLVASHVAGDLAVGNREDELVVRKRLLGSLQYGP